METGPVEEDEPDEMKTHAMDDELQALLDGEVEEGVEATLRAHLDACGDCTRLFRRMKATAGCFTLAMEAVDAGEPEGWSHARRPGTSGRIANSAENGGLDVAPARSAPPRRVPLRSISSRGLPAPMRWAAGLTLFLAGAASAALVLGVPILPGRDSAAPEAAADMRATAVPGAAVAVQPLDGAVEVLLVDVGPGSALQISFGEDGDVLVDVAGQGFSRFEVRDGSVTADLAGVPARVQVVVPLAIEEVLVSVGGQVVARAGGGVVSPAEAAGPGGWIPMGPQ